MGVAGATGRPNKGNSYSQRKMQYAIGSPKMGYSAYRWFVNSRGKGGCERRDHRRDRWFLLQTH